MGVLGGGGKGLGRAVVRALADDGADVAFSYRDGGSAAEEAAGALRASGRRTFVAKADARIPGQMAGFVEAAAGALGGVDFLVNNGGGFRPFSLEEVSEEALDEAVHVNVHAAVVAGRPDPPHRRRPGGWPAADEGRRRRRRR